MKRRSVIVLRIVAVVLAAAGVLVYVLRPPAAELPAQLGDARLMQLIDGDRANEILNRMHDKEVTPSTNLIGVYDAGSTVVYLSVYRSRGDAEKAYAKMARSIEKGNPLFSNYRVVRLADIDASYCFGQEQDHYFFSYKDRLYWLAADADVAEKTASALVAGL